MNQFNITNWELCKTESPGLVIITGNRPDIHIYQTYLLSTNGDSRSPGLQRVRVTVEEPAQRLNTHDQMGQVDLVLSSVESRKLSERSGHIAMNRFVDQP